jgi:hypothetical protein
MSLSSFHRSSFSLQPQTGRPIFSVLRWLAAVLMIAAMVYCGSSGSISLKTSTAAPLPQNVILPSVDYLSELHITIQRDDKLTCLTTSVGNWCGASKLHGTLVSIGTFESDPFFMAGQIFGGTPVSLTSPAPFATEYRLAVVDSIFVVSAAHRSAEPADLHIMVLLESGATVSCPLVFGDTAVGQCAPN